MVLEAGQPLRIAGLKRKDIGGFADRQGGIVEEHLDLFRAQPFDVESTAADEMPKPFISLRGADEATGAAADRVALFANGIRATFGAEVGEDVGHRFGGAFGKVHIGDLGDHIARAVDLHPVADADILALADRVAG